MEDDRFVVVLGTLDLLAVGGEEGSRGLYLLWVWRVNSVPVVAGPIAESVGSAVDSDLNVVPLVVLLVVARGVGEGVEVGVGGDNLRGDLGKAVFVVEGASASSFGFVDHLPV